MFVVGWCLRSVVRCLMFVAGRSLFLVCVACCVLLVGCCCCWFVVCCLKCAVNGCCLLLPVGVESC